MSVILSVIALSQMATLEYDAVGNHSTQRNYQGISAARLIITHYSSVNFIIVTEWRRRICKCILQLSSGILSVYTVHADGAFVSLSSQSCIPGRAASAVPSADTL